MHRRSARAAVVAVCAAATFAVAGCGGGGGSSSTESTTGQAPDTPASQASQGGVLHFALETSPSTLDPSQMTERPAIIITNQYAEALFESAEGGKVVPLLAESSELSGDGKTLTITLRSDVKFSNGQPMTSKDVAFSLEKMRKSPVNGTLYEAITKVSTPDPSTVVIDLKSVSPGMLAVLANYSSDIIPANYGGQSQKQFAQSPIGTGPYAVSGQHGQEVTLVPNKFYSGKATPHFEEMVFSVAADENTRLQQLRSGELQMSTATLLGTKTGLPPGSGVKVETTPQKMVTFILLNQDSPALKDQRMREAVNLAIDRQGIIATGTDGQGEEGLSYMPPTQNYFQDVKPPATDAEKAEALVKEATADGVKPEFEIWYGATDPYQRQAVQIIQQNLEAIGITVKLETLDEATLIELCETGEYDSMISFYNANLVDPEGLTKFYLSFFAPGAGQNVDALNKLSEAAAVETDESKREQLYVELQEDMIEEEGLLVLNYQPEAFAVSEEVTGVEFDGAGNMFLRNAGFSE
jgi:peptide/nickel transport system substrate-binding protein